MYTTVLWVRGMASDWYSFFFLSSTKHTNLWKRMLLSDLEISHYNFIVIDIVHLHLYFSPPALD